MFLFPSTEFEICMYYVYLTNSTAKVLHVLTAHLLLRILKEAKQFITTPITHLVKRSFEEGRYLSNIFKTYVIILLYKKR